MCQQILKNGRQCTRPGLWGFLTGTHCYLHKQIGMNNIKYCDVCGKRGTFGLDIFSQRKCLLHKTPEMFDVVNKRCEYKGCQKRASFGDPDDGIRKCCVAHIPGNKKGIYVIIGSKKCEYKGCQKQPSFGDPSDGIEKYCKHHIPEDKKGIYVDVANMKCEYDGCQKRPSFGDPDDGIEKYCKHHIPEDKKDIYVDVVHMKCEYKGCQKQPHFGDPDNGIRMCCVEHIPDDKKSTYVCLSMMACRSNAPPYNNLCPIRVQKSNRYDGFCAHCFRNYHPQDPRSLKGRGHSIEGKIATYIYVNYDSRYGKFIPDKPLLYGDCPCNQKRRIDLRMLIEGTLLCIEIDENQHRNYKQEDEIVRYNDLIAYHTGRMIFIRFNPDKYIDEKGNKRNPPFEERMKRLIQEIDHQVRRIEMGENIREDKLIEVVYLFYNSNKPRFLCDFEDDILFPGYAEDPEVEEKQASDIYVRGSPSPVTSENTGDEDCIYIPVDQELIRRYTQSPQKEAVIVLED
jgi:hypothetical protein